jgi:ribosomal protein S18 acetylase RimI-like enzyme
LPSQGGMSSATSVRACPRASCRSAGRRVETWRRLHPVRIRGRGDGLVSNASPAGNRVLTSPDGKFHVTYGTPTQLRDISDTQAHAFFEPITPVLDPLFLQYFKADVSVTLDRKYEYLDSRRFAPLVATAASLRNRDENESWRDPLLGRWPGSTRTPKNSDAGPGNATATATPVTASLSTKIKPTKEKKTTPPIVGVVELSIQRDADVASRLPAPDCECHDESGGALTPWADGAGVGGELQKWAVKRAADRNLNRRPAGRWKGGAPIDEYAYISCMCVKHTHRRRGVADALLVAAERVTVEWGYDVVALHVFAKNTAAIALYRKRGYEIVDRRSGAVDALLGKRRFLMVKKLV